MDRFRVFSRPSQDGVHDSMRCGVNQRRRATAGLQDRELRVPTCVLRQRPIQGQPSTLRNRVQHSRLGTGTTEPLPAWKAWSHSASSRQLAQQQPRSKAEEPTCSENGEDDHPQGRGQLTWEPHGRSRWPRRSWGTQFGRISGATPTIEHGHGRATDAPPS